jgi:hypothetical protein
MAMPDVVKSIEWTQIGDFTLQMGIFIDPITILMMGVITAVALMVNIFSIGYMKGEPRYFWYFALLQGFVASMLLLVMADNLLLVYVGMGTRRRLVLPAHRVLLGPAFGGRGGEEGVHHHSRRRRGPAHRHHPAVQGRGHLQH